MEPNRPPVALAEDDENTSVSAKTRLTEGEYAELRLRAKENVQSVSQLIRLYVRRGLIGDRQASV